MEMKGKIHSFFFFFGMTVFASYLEWDKTAVQEPEILEFLRILAPVS